MTKVGTRVFKWTQMSSLLTTFILFSIHTTQADSAPNMSTVESSEPSSESPYDRQFGANLGIQFPTGPAVELNYRPFRNFSLGVSGGGLALKDLSIAPETQKFGIHNSIEVLAFEAKVRWHPLDGAFFTGLAAGWQRFKVGGSFEENSIYGAIERFYFTPHLGWLWVMNSGFTVGTEFGLQIPLASPTLSQLGLNEIATETIQDIGSYVLPYVTLIKLGYSM